MEHSSWLQYYMTCSMCHFLLLRDAKFRYLSQTSIFFPEIPVGSFLDFLLILSWFEESTKQDFWKTWEILGHWNLATCGILVLLDRVEGSGTVCDSKVRWSGSMLTIWLYALGTPHQAVFDVCTSANHSITADHTALDVTPVEQTQSTINQTSPWELVHYHSVQIVGTCEDIAEELISGHWTLALWPNAKLKSCVLYLNIYSTRLHFQGGHFLDAIFEKMLSTAQAFIHARALFHGITLAP